jgi:hypothetical protein
MSDATALDGRPCRIENLSASEAAADVPAHIEAGPGLNNDRDTLDIRKVRRICKTGIQDQADDRSRNLLHFGTTHDCH